MLPHVLMPVTRLLNMAVFATGASTRIRWLVLLALFSFCRAAAAQVPETIVDEPATEGPTESSVEPAETEVAEPGDASEPTEAGETNDAEQAVPTPTEPLVLRAPWEPAEAPGKSDSFLFGEGRRYFFGLTPASIAEGVAMSPGGTGVTNLGGEFQASIAAFGGVAWTRWQVEPTHTMRFDLRSRALLSWERDQANSPYDTKTGYTGSLQVEAAEGEYLHYLAEPMGLPLFAGAWGGISGATAGVSKSLISTWQQDKRFRLPINVTVGGGVGRLYPIHWRIVIERLQTLLLRDGAIESEIPEHLAQQIAAQWYADRDGLTIPPDPDNPFGWRAHEQILAALQILHQEGILARPIPLTSAYAVEQIILDEANVDRWVGWDARLGLRTLTGFDRTWAASSFTKNDPTTSFAVEARGRFYYNLSSEADLRFDPTLAVAPRAEDEINNNLVGARRVSLDAAPIVGSPSSFFPTGRVVLDLPATLSRYVYDPSYNLQGHWNLHAGLALGYATVATSNELGGALSAGAAYTSYSSSRTGVTMGLDLGLGYLGEIRYQVNLIAAVSFGTADLVSGGSRYVAPDQVGDEVPFNTDWIPKPSELGVAE